MFSFNICHICNYGDSLKKFDNMSILDKITNKDEKKTSREVGSNFDKDEADEIFDNIDKTITDKKTQTSKGLKKQINLTKDISELLNQAKSSDDNQAIEIYKKVIAIAPDNETAYSELSKIYAKNNDTDNEIKILKLGIQNLTGSKKENLIKRLKEINH